MVIVLNAFLEEALGELERAGVEEAELRLGWIVEHALSIPRLEIPLCGPRPLSPGEHARLGRLVARLKDREPVQHLIGWVPFLGLRLEVGPQALVPRPETEILVQAALEALDRGRKAPVVLDMGTGTGCVALAIALQLPGALCHAVDISPEALELARRNRDSHRLSSRVRIWRSDWFRDLPPGIEADLIVSNPPYIPTGRLGSLPQEVRDHDPVLALDGGPEGLDPYSVLAREGQRWLRPGGQLLCEADEEQMPALEAIFGKEGWRRAALVRDLSGLERVARFEPLPG